MKTGGFVYRNIYLIYLPALLFSGLISYSQQTTEQITTFGFHAGFYFPEQHLNLSQISGDSCRDNSYNHHGETVLNSSHLYFPGYKTPTDSANNRFSEPLCRIPEYSRVELNAMRKQQALMWEQYHKSWLKQEFYEKYSIDLEGIVRGIRW